MVNAYNYTPCKIDLIKDFGINVGDIITVDGITTMIMSKSWDNTGVKLESTGNATREIASSQNSEILALRGKTNVLTRTLEETTNKMTSIETDMGTVKSDVSEVKQTASSLTSTVSSVQQDLNSYKNKTDQKISSVESKIEQQAGSITTTVTNNVNNYVDGKFTGVNQEITQIKQDATSISSTVQGLSGDVNEVKQSLDGVVYSSSLADGTTTINGGCIKTGTINADRINMTGAISWGDLDNNLQTTINEAGGSGGLTTSEVKTLITDQLVSSPNIQGANYWSEDRKTHMDLLDATSVSAGIGGGIEVKGGSTQIFKACRSATLNVTLSSYSNDFLQVTSTGSIRPLGDWDFSSATVTGLSGSGSGSGSGSTTVVAVFG